MMPVTPLGRCRLRDLHACLYKEREMWPDPATTCSRISPTLVASCALSSLGRIIVLPGPRICVELVASTLCCDATLPERLRFAKPYAGAALDLRQCNLDRCGGFYSGCAYHRTKVQSSQREVLRHARSCGGRRRNRRIFWRPATAGAPGCHFSR